MFYDQVSESADYINSKVNAKVDVAVILGSGLAILVNVSKMDFVYPLVFIWAYSAIAIQQMNQHIILVVCCAAILLIALVMDRYKKTLQE